MPIGLNNPLLIKLTEQSGRLSFRRRRNLFLVCSVLSIFISSCSTGPLCPAFSSEHHSIFSMNGNPFSHNFLTSHGTGEKNPFMSNIFTAHGGFGEWMNPFGSSKMHIRGGASQSGPFTTKGGIKHGGQGGDDVMFASNSKHHTSANGSDSFKKKDKRHGDKPPDKTKETGLWPKSMRLP